MLFISNFSKLNNKKAEYFNNVFNMRYKSLNNVKRKKNIVFVYLKEILSECYSNLFKTYSSWLLKDISIQ